MVRVAIPVGPPVAGKDALLLTIKVSVVDKTLEFEGEKAAPWRAPDSAKTSIRLCAAGS